MVTAQPFFLFPPRVISIYYAGNPYLCYGAKIILPPPHTISTIMSSFPPPPSAPGGGGYYHGRSGGRGNGKLYIATQKARAAAARRKEARANLLAPPPPSTPSNRAARYKIRSDEKSLNEAPPATKLPRQKIIFDELTPVAETTTPFESSPPVVASPPLQQPTGVELPALQPFELPALLQFPGGVLNTQPPTVDVSPTQLCDAFMPTAASDELYALHEHDEDEVLLSSDDEEVAVKAACAASQLCRDPNNDTDDYRFCLNCNVEAHLICTEQMNFQTPALDKFVITHHDFSFGGKERLKKTPRQHRHQVVFCLMCKARMLQKKIHPTKNLESAPRKKKGKFGPPAVLLRNLRKLAAYHCQTIVFTTVDKTSEKAKHAAIEEAFYGNVSKNIIGACQQLVDGDHAFALLYNTNEGDDGNVLCLKSSCCGEDTSSFYVAGRDFTAKCLETFSNGKPFQGRAIWKMADTVLASLKKALSLVPQLSPKIVNIDSTCRVVGYASGKNEQSFLQAIDNGMHEMDKSDRMGLSPDDDKRLGCLSAGDEDEDADAGSAVVEISNDDGTVTGVGYSYTGKLAFICFGPLSKFYSPILSTGGSMNLSIEERKKGSRSSIRKIQEEKATLERVTGHARGITQQNRMQFGLMAQNEDSAAQAHRDLRVVTIMKRAELTQKMIQMKMTMWEKMVDGAAKENLYGSIHDLFVKAEDLENQLQEVGSEERVCNPIVLSVLSNVATSMGLSSLKTSGETESDYND